ncbi:2-oxoglutarate (2OG) and Fe(II)-dependent oxygenase superfamily protein [Artemisia annua]|uniref:2-oxoglutarate (2OG) and Fe(II)-dependent oxygenase superfamily protein n=1 Tax=Artemisia annua TaxID=35608 RepID=A0A2U1N1N3_ARTAN|nr:2-oxoglutarate (2OG) and Fe(II)-dependent oxygenase superfamily protein [Artemisia annua]
MRMMFLRMRKEVLNPSAYQAPNPAKTPSPEPTKDSRPLVPYPSDRELVSPFLYTSSDEEDPTYHPPGTPERPQSRPHSSSVLLASSCSQTRARKVNPPVPEGRSVVIGLPCAMRFGDLPSWANELSTSAMSFGDLPSWANELSTSVREVVQYSDYDPESVDTNTCEMDEEECIFPLELLRREPLFNRLIVNSYQPSEFGTAVNGCNGSTIPICALLYTQKSIDLHNGREEHENKGSWIRVLEEEFPLQDPDLMYRLFCGLGAGQTMFQILGLNRLKKVQPKDAIAETIGHLKGSIKIVLHAPQERAIESVTEVWDLATEPDVRNVDTQRKACQVLESQHNTIRRESYKW